MRQVLLRMQLPLMQLQDFTPVGAGFHPVCELDPKPTHLFGNLHIHSVMTTNPSWFATVDDTPQKSRDLA